MTQASQAAQIAQAVTAEKSITPDQLAGLLEQVLEQTERSRGMISLTPTGVEFGNFEGVQRYAAMLYAAGIGPKPGKDDNPQTMIAKMTAAIILGRKIDLQPEMAVTMIYVVNGVATLFGDAPLAICRQHNLWDESGWDEYWEVDGKRVDGDPSPDSFKVESTAAVCQSMRKGSLKPRIARFSVAHAKAANLFGKNQSLYGIYPQRMLRFRARGYNLRDNFGDALKGLGIRELQDEHGDVPPPAPSTEPPVGRLSARPNGASTPAETPAAVVVDVPIKPADPQPQETVCTRCKRQFATVDDFRAGDIEGKCPTQFAFRDPDAAFDCEEHARKLADAEKEASQEPFGDDPPAPESKEEPEKPQAEMFPSKEATEEPDPAALADLENDLLEQIEKAATEKIVASVGTKLAKHRAELGEERYRALAEKYQQKFEELKAKRNPKK